MKIIFLLGLIGLILISGCTQPPPTEQPPQSGKEYVCPDGTVVVDSNDCLIESQDSLIVANPSEFALNIVDVEPGYTKVISNFSGSVSRYENKLSFFVAYNAPGYKTPGDPLGEKYNLLQFVDIAYGKDLNEAITNLGGLPGFVWKDSETINENFMADESRTFREGTYWKDFGLQFREKNVLVTIKLTTQTLPEDLAIQKLEEYANIVYDRISKALLAYPLPPNETESLFGTCENDKTCEEGLLCNKSQFCSMTMDGVFCSDEGDEKCYKQCSTDEDCQDLCNEKVDCTEYLTKCHGTIRLWSGDTVWPAPVCMIFKKTARG